MTHKIWLVIRNSFFVLLVLSLVLGTGSLNGSELLGWGCNNARGVANTVGSASGRSLTGVLRVNLLTDCDVHAALIIGLGASSQVVIFNIFQLFDISAWVRFEAAQKVTRRPRGTFFVFFLF